MPADPNAPHVCQFRGAIYADSHVLQSASAFGWAVRHAGFGDFIISRGGNSLYFMRIDGSADDTAMREDLGWEPHGRIHKVQRHSGALTHPIRTLLSDWAEFTHTIGSQR